MNCSYTFTTFFVVLLRAGRLLRVGECPAAREASLVIHGAIAEVLSECYGTTGGPGRESL